jgi:hypothetical protein
MLQAGRIDAPAGAVSAGPKEGPAMRAPLAQRPDLAQRSFCQSLNGFAGVNTSTQPAALHCIW